MLQKNHHLVQVVFIRDIDLFIIADESDKDTVLEITGDYMCFLTK